ncbi:MAG TPA: hypothetical protein VN030_09540 [Cellvibrio sp.]|nr:hypothetical protein [Cellvibrio sp.]
MSVSMARTSKSDGFIFFSPQTLGHVGRTVKIHTNLFFDFLCSVNPHSAEGQMVIRDIESLRSLAENKATAAFDPIGGRNDSAEHIQRKHKIQETLKRMATIAHHKKLALENSLITKNVRVYYNIYIRETDICPTVYISEIQVINKGNKEAGGFYEATTGAFGGKLIKAAKCNLEGKTVFVSAATATAYDAMKDAQVVSKGINSVVFFNPPSVTEDLTFGKKNRLTETTQTLVKEFQATLRDNKDRTVNWVVAGEGAALLSHALDGSNENLEKHSFKFVNPKADLSDLLQKLSARKADMGNDFISIDKALKNSAFSSMMVIATQKDALMTRLTNLPLRKMPEMGLDVNPETFLRLDLLKKVSDVASLGALTSIARLPQALEGKSISFIEAVMRVRTR